MSFDAKALGFEDVSTARGGAQKDYCYFRLSAAANRKGKTQLTLNIDEETAYVALELFGARCNVAVDDKGRVVLYAGNARTISTAATKSRQRKTATVSMDSAKDKVTDALGEFRVYRLESKIWAKGEAILFTPVERVS